MVEDVSDDGKALLSAVSDCPDLGGSYETHASFVNGDLQPIDAFAALLNGGQCAKWCKDTLGRIGVTAPLPDAPSAAELAALHAKACCTMHAAAILTTSRKGGITKALSDADDDCDAGVIFLKNVFERVWERTPLDQGGLFDAAARSHYLQSLADLERNLATTGRRDAMSGFLAEIPLVLRVPVAMGIQHPRHRV